MAETEDEIVWTDDMIRWDDVKPKSKDESDEEEEAMFNPFKDPDPIKTFTYRFPRPILHKDKDGGFIEVQLQGYLSDADEVWQSTGVTLWRAATFLCEFMMKNVDLFQNKSSLELGAGLGLNGILAHLMTSEGSTCLTDGDTDALIHLRENVKMNRVKERIDDITCHQLLWGSETSEKFLEKNSRGQKFDILLASDIIYVKSIIAPLWETVQTLLTKKNGVFVMAFAKRRVPVSIEFVLQSAEEAGFTHELVSEHHEGIWVYLFRWK